MKPSSDDLVRVHSESELRAGVAVWIRRCRLCGKDEAFVLLRPHRGRCVINGTEGIFWATAPTKCDGQNTGFSSAIAEGRLYRLKDDSESSEQQRTKQRERVE